MSHLCITSGRRYCNSLGTVLQAGLEFLLLINIFIPYIIQHNKVPLPTSFLLKLLQCLFMINLIGLIDVACKLNNVKILRHPPSGAGNTPGFLGHCRQVEQRCSRPSHPFQQWKADEIPVTSLTSQYTHDLLFSSYLDILTMSFSESSMMESIMRHYLDALGI